MRTVTIKREKSFVACIARMKVYVEDHNSAEITIGGVPCRKLGTLKNGEMQSFQVEECALKLFVISDTLSKDFSNDFYQLPEGSDYVSVSGKNRYNPAAGNPFRFNGNEGAEVAENRKRGTRIGLIVLLVAIVVGFGIGLSVSRGINVGMAILEAFTDTEVADKTFTAGDMKITLTNKFVKRRKSGYEAVFESNDVAVFVLKESFEGQSSYSTKSYAEMLIEANDIVAKPKSDGERTYFEYRYYNPDDGITYYYISYVYKTNKSFWTVQFALTEEDQALYAGWIGSWANSVCFTE